MRPQVCVQSNDSQMGAGETLGRKPGDGARWICDLGQLRSTLKKFLGFQQQQLFLLIFSLRLQRHIAGGRVGPDNVPLQAAGLVLRFDAAFTA